MLEKLRLKPVVLVTGILLGILILSPVAFSLSPNSVTINGSGTIDYDNDSTASLALHVSGSQILNANNQTVILHGVNTGGLGDNPDGTWDGVGFNTFSSWNSTSGQADVMAQLNGIHSWGCNVIRIMYRASWWMSNDGGERQMVVGLANDLASLNMYLLFEGYYVSGTTQDPLPYPPYQASSGESATIPSAAAYVNLFVNISNTLKGCPNVILGLWNEAGQNAGDTSSEATQWFSVVQQCITFARGNGSSNIIMPQWQYNIYCNEQYPASNSPPSYTTSYTTLQWIEMMNLNGTNIAYETHYYDGFQYPSGDGGGIGNGGLTYNETMTGMNLCWVPYVLNTLHKPIVFGEIGADMAYSGADLTQELSDFNYTLAALNSLGVGYLAWEWRVGTEYALITSNGPSFTPSSAGTILINEIAAV